MSMATSAPEAAATPRPGSGSCPSPGQPARGLSFSRPFNKNRSTSPASAISNTNRSIVHDSLLRSLYVASQDTTTAVTTPSPFAMSAASASASASGLGANVNKARGSDFDNKYIRCIHPAPQDIVNLSQNPSTGEPIPDLDTQATIDPSSLTAALSTPTECRIWSPAHGTSYPLVYPDALRTALGGRAPLVALIPAPVAPVNGAALAPVIPVLASPTGGVTVVYRLLGTQGDVLALPESDSEKANNKVVVGIVPLASSCVLLCTQSARYALQVLPAHLMPARSGAAAAHAPLAWTPLPEPGPATLLSSIIGKFTSADPARVLAVALADNARHALVLTTKSLEMWGPASAHAPLELKRQSLKSIEYVVLGDSKDQFTITHLASTSFAFTDDDALPVIVAVRANGRDGATQLRTVHDPWTRDAAVSISRPVESGASELDPIRAVHFVAPAQCKTVVQSASGVEVVADAGAKAYLWNPGKRWFVASAPIGGTGGQRMDRVPSVVLLELSRGMYEFRASGFDRPTAATSALVTPAAAAAAPARGLFTPRAGSPTQILPTPLPPRTPRAQLALESVGDMSDAAKHLFDRANNLFRAHAGMQVPSDDDLEHVARAFVHLGMQQPEAAEEYSDRLMHLADLVSTVAERDQQAEGHGQRQGQGRLEVAIGDKARARVWHAAVALAVVGAQANNQVERTGGTDSSRYYVQVPRDDKDDAAGKFVSKAADRYWAAMRATEGARAVSKSRVLDPFEAVLRGAMAKPALELAGMLTVEDEVESIVGVAVRVADWLIRFADKGVSSGEDTLTLAEAITAAARVLTLAHAGLASDAATHAWRDTVRLLAQVDPLPAYTLAQMHDSHVELRAQILAAGQVPDADEAIETQLRADQAFANALFKTLLAAAEETEPSGEVAGRWAVAVDKAVKFPDRFEVFLDGGGGRSSDRVQVPALVLSHYFVAVGNYAEAMPHWFEVLLTTPVEATAVQAVSALYFYQWVLRDEPLVARAVDMGVVDHYQALLDTQRDLAPTIAAAAGLRFAPGQYAELPTAIVDVDVPQYVQLAVKRGGRLPLPWLIDAATPVALVRLARLLSEAPDSVVGSVRYILWAKVYHRALYLLATVPMNQDMHVFCDREQGRQEWLRDMMPHGLAPGAWTGSMDAMRPLTPEQIKAVEAEVGGVRWGMIAPEDLEATVAKYSHKIRAKAVDGRVAEVTHAIAILDVVFRKEQGQDVEMDEQEHEGHDESMMVETERRFDQEEQEQGSAADDEDAMEM